MDIPNRQQGKKRKTRLPCIQTAAACVFLGMVNFARPLTGHPEHPDHRIADDVLQGNRHAYGQLMQRHWSRIFARVQQFVGSHEDAEEVTLDAFNKAYENLHRFRWEASFSTWLYQIASNLARNRYWHNRRRFRHRTLSLEMELGDDGFRLEDVIPDAQADPGDRLRWSEFHQAIENRLHSMPGPHREIMEMRLLDHLSYEEIAARLAVPVGTVKSRIARARGHLTRSLGISPEQSVQAHAQELARGRR